jgi:crotonobetaine/carnitine-CoA ligase
VRGDQGPTPWPAGTGPGELTLPALLQWRAAELDGKPLLRIGSVTRSYRQVADAAARMAAALADRGVSRGDRVAALCGNRIELMDLILGCGWLGATVVPLNTALRGTSLRQALDAAGASFVLAEPRLAARLDEAAPTGLRARWVAGPVPGGWSPGWQPAPCPDGYAPRPAAAVGPADTLAILFTSGTTGTPLGVCSPHGQFAWWGINVSRTLRIVPDDVLYTCLPLFHTNALNAFAQAIVAGATYVLGTRFSASAFWDELREADATVTYLLGAMAGILLSRPPAAGDRAHRCRVALAPATPAHQQGAFRERFGILLVDGFGSTETNLVIGALPEEQRPGYLGRARDGFEVAVVGDDDQPVPDGTPGELLVRSQHGHAFATGYWQRPDRTAEAWRGQWFHTGDRVIRDPAGWFTFVDRIKDVIRRRGENISSRQVEEVLTAHEDVVAAAAFAVPAEFAEDEVMVAVVRQPASTAGPADLLRHCEQQLPYFAVPRYVDLVDQLPLTETGKIAKSELRQRGITPTTWDRTAAGKAAEKGDPPDARCPSA